MNPGKGERTNKDSDRRRLLSVSRINHKHSPLTFNGLLIQIMISTVNHSCPGPGSQKPASAFTGPKSSEGSAVNHTINRVGVSDKPASAAPTQMT